MICAYPKPEGAGSSDAPARPIASSDARVQQALFLPMRGGLAPRGRAFSGNLANWRINLHPSPQDLDQV